MPNVRFTLEQAEEGEYLGEETGRIVLEGEVVRMEFAAMVLGLMDETLGRCGVAGYRRMWSAVYPLDWHAMLASLLGRTEMVVPLGLVGS